MAVYEAVQTIVYGAFEASIAPHETLIDRFAAVLDTAVALNRDDPSIAGFVVGVAGEAQRHPELRDHIAQLRGAGSGFLRQLAEDAAANGELADDVSVEALEDLLNAVLSGLARFSNQTGDADRHTAAVAVLKRFLDGTLMRR